MSGMMEEEGFPVVLEMIACHGKDEMMDAVFAGKTMGGERIPSRIGGRFLHDAEAGGSESG